MKDFKGLTISIEGCSSIKHFESVASIIKNALENDCAFGVDGNPIKCCESGDYCKDCARENVKICSNELNVEYEWED